MVTVDYFRSREYIKPADYRYYRDIKGKTKYSAKHNK